MIQAERKRTTHEQRNMNEAEAWVTKTQHGSHNPVTLLFIRRSATASLVRERSIFSVENCENEGF